MKTDLYFLARDKLFDLEKPYTMRYLPQSDIPQSNVRRVAKVIEVKDMRDSIAGFRLDDNGFEVLLMESAMRYEDFADDDKINSVYKREISEALKHRFGATHVRVMDHAVRRRHPQFPISTGKDYKHDQPTSMAHIDFTMEEGERMIRNTYGSQAPQILKGRWQVINVWKPLKGPLRDWPLGLCDSRTLDMDNDTMPGDIVYPRWLTENIQIHHNSRQAWWFLNDQSPEELLVFKSADSQRDSVNPCPHAGIFNPNATADDLPRESIDCRCFVFYADLDLWPAEEGEMFTSHL